MITLAEDGTEADLAAVLPLLDELDRGRALEARGGLTGRGSVRRPTTPHG